MKASVCRITLSWTRRLGHMKQQTEIHVGLRLRALLFPVPLQADISEICNVAVCGLFIMKSKLDETLSLLFSQTFVVAFWSMLSCQVWRAPVPESTEHKWTFAFLYTKLKSRTAKTKPGPSFSGNIPGKLIFVALSPANSRK